MTPFGDIDIMISSARQDELCSRHSVLSAAANDILSSPQATVSNIGITAYTLTFVEYRFHRITSIYITAARNRMIRLRTCVPGCGDGSVSRRNACVLFDQVRGFGKKLRGRTAIETSMGSVTAFHTVG
jgi:hypothetical protein